MPELALVAELKKTDFNIPVLEEAGLDTHVMTWDCRPWPPSVGITVKPFDLSQPATWLTGQDMLTHFTNT